jgi:protease-4
MPKKFGETLATAIFLVACLIAGLRLADVYAPKPVIGVARFEGLIDTASARQMGTILDAARRDDRVVGVVLEISSPGGDAGSSEKLYHAMLQLRQQKPLVVAIDGIATSGGYYMAVAGNKIYATASSDVGNVGVIIGRPFDPEIWPGLLTTGPFKLSGGSRFDNVYRLELVKEAFVGNVVHQRSHSPYNPLQVDARTVAEAHLYVGSEALAVGLIDAHGSRSDAILDVAELAGVKKYQVLELTDYLALPFEPSLEVRSMLDAALPGAVFLLDSRVPLDATMPAQWEAGRLSTLGRESPARPGDGFWPYNLGGGSRR